jgi:hypothetical protein
MKPTVATAALVTLISAGSAFGQVSEAAGLRTTVPFEIGRYDLNVGGAIHRVATPVGQRTPFSFESSVRVPRGASGFWLGARMEGAPEVDSTPMRPLLGAGFWTTLRRLTVSVGGATRAARIEGRAAQSRPVQARVPVFRDTGSAVQLDSTGVEHVVRIGFWENHDTTLTVTDSGVASRVALWSDVEGRIAWTVGRASMEAVVGARPRIGRYASTAWTRIGASYPLNDRLSLAAFAGTDPGHVGLGVPSSMFASIALRARPWRRTAATGRDLGPLVAFTAAREGAAGYRVTYLAPNAKTVEVSGDFNRWSPVTLRQTHAGVWEATLPLRPGTYRVNVRIDGGRWLPPAGLPQAEDDFNGAVGVLVVR